MNYKNNTASLKITILDKKFILLFYILFSISLGISNSNNDKLNSFYNLKAININGNVVKMDKYRNKKILIVNVASKCGYTYQYHDLQAIHKKYGDFVEILGFPSNDFFWQEPGSNLEIKNFCKINFGVTFQMFEKIHVKGRKQHEIYKWLSDKNLNGWNDRAPSWNFCKYLINETGELIEYFDSKISPKDSIVTKHFVKQQ